MIVLDTTVLVYAVGEPHRFRDPCRELVEAVGEARVRATTTAEVIQEFAHVRARRRGRLDAAALAGHYADLLGPLLTTSADDLRRGLDHFAREEALGAFDAVLIATAASASAHTIVSADAAFARAVGATHVVPDAAGVASLLSATAP